MNTADRHVRGLHICPVVRTLIIDATADTAMQFLPRVLDANDRTAEREGRAVNLLRTLAPRTWRAAR